MSGSEDFTTDQRRRTLQYYAVEQAILNRTGQLSSAQAAVNIANFATYLARSTSNPTAVAIEDMRLVIVGEGFVSSNSLLGPLFGGRSEGQYHTGKHFLTASGFQSQFGPDTGDQVQHLIAGIVIRYQHGAAVAQGVLWDENSPHDVALYQAAYEIAEELIDSALARDDLLTEGSEPASNLLAKLIWQKIGDGSVQPPPDWPTDAELLEQMESEVDRVLDPGLCFAAGTPVRMADGTEKPIERVMIGDWVMSFDSNANNGRGALMPSQVTRTMVNHSQLLLDFHGTKVTPGHVFLTGDESPEGKAVFKRLIDILVKDGTVVNAEGTVLRAATNFPVGSPEDRFVEVAEIWPENGTIGSRPARLRAGTLLIGDDGTATTLLDCMTREGFELLPGGRVSHRGGPSQPMLMQAPVPRPETYVLKRSELTLEQIYSHASLRDVAPSAMAARAMRRPRADASAPASVGMQMAPADAGGGWPQGWTPSADNDAGLAQRPVLPTNNRATRRRAEAHVRKQAKRKLH